MINKACLDPLEEAVDCFEENWSLESRSEISSILTRFDLVENAEAITELIRVDIELRYQLGLSIQLDDYLDQFGALQAKPGFVAQIAFEDFRSRTAHGHPVPVSRWRGIAGIEQQSWFQQLSASRSDEVSRPIQGIDSSFQQALKQIGFRLVHLIGSGRFSRVFLATQDDLADRFVVLKVVNHPLSEPENMAMLQHTNIVPIYSFHRIANRSVICMPYAGRVTLADFMLKQGQAHLRGGASLIDTVRRRIDTSTGRHDDDVPAEQYTAFQEFADEWSGPTPAADEKAVLIPLERLRDMSCHQLALWLFQRIAAGLAHSHVRGVLHRDLKPENVLIRNDGEPALLDFNLSQVEGREAEYAGGTLPYMAPETYRLLMRQDVTTTRQSDIYGLGVMLFEFVTGRRPYDSPAKPSVEQLTRAVDARREPLPWKDDEKVPAGTRSIIEKCLAFDPADRYDNAAELRQDLDCELNDRPLALAAEPVAARCSKWVRRHPRLTSGGSVAALLVALLIPLSWWAVTAQRRSAHLSALAKIEDFDQASSDALRSWMADPLRFNDDRIEAAMQPLAEFGLLHSDGLQQFDSSLMSEDQRRASRRLILRYLGHVTFSEIFRLQKLVAPDSDESLDDQALTRLDQLIELGQRLSGDTKSRAFLFAAAERAHLAGQHERGDALAEEAEKLTLDDRTAEYLEAVRLMTHRRWSEATALLSALADHEDISSSLRWTMLGRSQYEGGNYEDAKISFTQSIQRAPDSARLWYLRGRCYSRLGKHQRAVEDFAKALELEPGLIVALANRGLSRLAMADAKRKQQDTDGARALVQRAIADFTAGLQQSPDNVELMILRSRAYSKIGDQVASQRDYQTALETPLTSSALLSKRARARRSRGDYEGALQDLEKAASMDRRSPSILLQMADVQAEHLKDIEAAIETLCKIETIDSDDPENLQINRAVMYARLQRYSEAKHDLELAMKGPNTARTLYQAACVNALLPDEADHQKAVRLLAKAVRAGYGAEVMQDDADLNAIRELPGFLLMQRFIRLGNGKIRSKSPAVEGNQP